MSYLPSGSQPLCLGLCREVHRVRGSGNRYCTAFGMSDLSSGQQRICRNVIAAGRLRKNDLHII